MLNKSAATDARHSRSGKDAMLYNSAGKPFAQVESFTTKGSFNNYKYAPLGQNRELEVNGTVGVTVNISEIVVLDGELFNAVINAIANGESPVLMFTGVIEGRNGSQERVTYRECILSGDSLGRKRIYGNYEYSRCRYCPNGNGFKCCKESNSTGRNVPWSERRTG